MMEPRFNIVRGSLSGNIYVLDIPVARWRELSRDAQMVHEIITIRTGGMVSELLARTWAQQICDQLNQFDVANATVAKLTG